MNVRIDCLKIITDLKFDSNAKRKRVDKSGFSSSITISFNRRISTQSTTERIRISGICLYYQSEFLA